MGLFNKNNNEETAENNVQQPEDSRMENEEKNPETKDVQDLAKHVFTTENNGYILAYDEDTLIYEHKRKHGEYDLNDTTVVTYENEEGLRGVRELDIWVPDSGLFGGKKVDKHSLYKIDGGIGFSKKESDTYFHLFHDIKTCLEGKILFFTPEKEFVDIQLDNTDRVLRAFLGKKARYIRYRDIIGADLDTHTKTLATTKTHVGRALARGTGADGQGNGAPGVSDPQAITSIEGYDIIIYLNNDSLNFIKKSYNADEADLVQELFLFLQQVVQENGESGQVVTESAQTQENESGKAEE